MAHVFFWGKIHVLYRFIFIFLLIAARGKNMYVLLELLWDLPTLFKFFIFQHLSTYTLAKHTSSPFGSLKALVKL